MKKKGLTLVELIVVLGLLGIVLPLAFNIYLNQTKVENYISTNVNVQADGSFAINEINNDLRLSTYVSNDYKDELDQTFDTNNFLPDGSIAFNGQKYISLDYVKSLSSTKDFIYATTAPDLTSAGDIYKLFINQTPDSGSIKKYELVTNPNSVEIASSANIFTEFPGIVSSNTPDTSVVQDFENEVFYDTAIGNDIKRNEINIQLSDTDPLLSDIPLNTNTNDHFIVLGCFNYEGANYVYFRHDITGDKYFAQLEETDYPVNTCSIDNAQLVISDVSDFNISLNQITYNIKFNKEGNMEQEYPFNVDVNPLNLGGGN